MTIPTLDNCLYSSCIKVHIWVHFDHVPLSTISSKRLPVSTFKDAVHLSPNDYYYLVTDSEGNIGNMRFFRPIPEPQVTEQKLLQENKNDIVGNKILHCGKLMDMFNKFYNEHGQNEPRCELSCNWNTNKSC
jgi:hypothetical protein